MTDFLLNAWTVLLALAFTAYVTCLFHRAAAVQARLERDHLVCTEADTDHDHLYQLIH